MLRLLPRLFLARCAAALLAVALSGAPGIASSAAALTGGPRPHRCACAAHAGGEHECACGACRREALRASANDGRAPACHRAAARRALDDRERSSPAREHAPCAEGACGAGTALALTAAAQEPFCPPGAPAARAWLSRPATTGAPALASGGAPAPEAPPPRTA